MSEHREVPVATSDLVPPTREAVTLGTKHITVCICTYRRPRMLEQLLKEVAGQETAQRFTYSIVIVDNDHLRSAEAVVRQFQAGSSVPVRYCLEPRQNIPRARNRAVENAIGDFVAFIDDDELPSKRWLLTLFEACNDKVAGVLGPVKPRFDGQPPKWVVKGRFYERPTYPTGFVIDWRKGRTGNVLLKRLLFCDDAEPFRPEFLTGEDQDFFRRMVEKGHVFTWCSEAVAYEVIPPGRWKRRFLLRRALLRGKVSPIHPTFGAVDIGKSVIAVPAYTVALPIALMFGQGAFMRLTVKLVDHIGRLLALLGVNPVTEPYVTD